MKSSIKVSKKMFGMSIFYVFVILGFLVCLIVTREMSVVKMQTVRLIFLYVLRDLVFFVYFGFLGFALSFPAYTELKSISNAKASFSIKLFQLFQSFKSFIDAIMCNFIAAFCVCILGYFLFGAWSVFDFKYTLEMMASFVCLSFAIAFLWSLIKKVMHIKSVN